MAAKFKMGDDLIAVVRELVQLSLITGTNIVDHLRSIEMEMDTETNKLVPTVEYVEAYNSMVEELVEKANQAQKKLDLAKDPESEPKTLAFSLTPDDDDSEPEDLN